MNRIWSITLGLLLAFSGCRAGSPRLVSQISFDSGLSSTQTVVPTVADRARKQTVQRVGFQELESEREPDSELAINATPAGHMEPVVATAFRSNSRPVLLSELEQIALTMNPAIAEIEAEIESLRGKATQASLPPNPRVGVNAEDIFEEGTAGRYGVFFGQEVVRGNKLGRSKSVVCAEIEAAEQRFAVMRQRLLTDVRQRYYDLLVAQETVRTSEQLFGILKAAVETSEKLFEAKEVPQTSVLQSEVELQNAEVVKRQAENQTLAARRKLAALIGEEDIPSSSVDGNPRDIIAMDDFEQSFDQLINASPEIAALFAEVEQRKRQHAREQVEPIPNLTWQTTIQYDTVSDNVVGGFQLGMPIPTLNRNQGAIHQARYSIVAAERRAEKKVLELRQRLATAYENYHDAKLQIEAYDREIIPKAKETLDLVSKGYREGEIDFLQFLTAQRTYSQINLTYLTQLGQLWRQHVEIQGMLLSESLK